MNYIKVNKSKVNEIAKGIASGLGNGSILLLFGNLGTGKTYFTNQICNCINVKELVSSPSYILLNEYEGKYKVFHYDLYRLSSAEEAFELGIIDRITDGITIVEWPEIICDYLPDTSTKIHFSHNGKFRDITIS